MPWPSILPLIAAVAYATGALLVKRAADLGVGVWRSAFVANIVGAVIFQPLWLLGGTVHAELWWQPVIAGALFMIGQWLTFMSLDRGDVTVATPVLGLKILLVAVIGAVLGAGALRGQIWAAAVLATAGIALLNRRSSSTAHHHVGRTIFLAGSAAAVFALFDVLVQRWAPAWGAGCFLPLVMAVSGVLSFAFVPRFRAPLAAIPRPAWPWLLGGTTIFATQSVVFVSTIATWGAAASANVLYSSRGLWSVALVWIAGHWVQSREQQLGRSILAWRLGGAGLMLSAIVLVVL